MGGLGFLSEELERLRERGLLREPDDELAAASSGLLDASSNDYLGLADSSVSRETLDECLGTPLGAGASRLIYGTSVEHLQAESAIAAWLGAESALLFSSGYAANLGVLTALAAPGHLVLSDALNHASIIDGCRLSRAEVRVIRHLDLDALEHSLADSQGYQRRWVVTESYFSMDGDSPDLNALRELCDRYGAHLVVDEAHALGVLGPEGAGLCRARRITPDVLVGTLGKSLGLQGAFVTGPALLRRWLWNRSRAFVFSTATSPLLARLTALAVRRVRSAGDRREALERNASRLRHALHRTGLQGPATSHGPIIPIILGDERRAIEARDRLRTRGIRVQAIRPPTVPAGTARLRVTVKATMSLNDIDRLAAELEGACR